MRVIFKTHQTMRRLLTATLLFMAAVWAVASNASSAAYTVETVPNVHVASAVRYTSDPSGILSAQARDSIDAICARLEHETGIETAVVMLPSIGEATPFDFDQQLFRRWGIGKKKQNNGLLVLFVMDQRRVRFHTGYGIEGWLTDAMSKRIQTTVMVPAFRRNDWDVGMTAGMRAVYSVLQGSMRPDAKKGSGNGADQLLTVLLAIAVIVAVIVIGGRRQRCARCGSRGVRLVSRQTLRDSYGHRIVRETWQCPHCGNITTRDRDADPPGGGTAANVANAMFLASMMGRGRGGGGSMGGGSFGGGDSGGGGAESGW